MQNSQEILQGIETGFFVISAAFSAAFYQLDNF